MAATAPMDPNFSIIIVPGVSLPSQPWWNEAHKMIIESYKVKDFYTFPTTWTRLDIDPGRGAKGLASELGDNGYLAIAFTENNRPIACGGILPFRGESWINEASKKTDVELANSQSGTETISDWETCCFCVHPSARGQGLSHRVLDELIAFLRAKGGERIFTNYVRDEIGTFWPKMGFEIIPGAGGMLPKGFKRDPELEGLRADIHFEMGVRKL